MLPRIGKCLVHNSGDVRHVVSVYQVEAFAEITDDRWGQARQLCHLFGPHHVIGRDIPFPEPHVDRGQRNPELFPAASQLILRVPLGRDIFDEEDDQPSRQE